MDRSWLCKKKSFDKSKKAAAVAAAAADSSAATLAPAESQTIQASEWTRKLNNEMGS